MATKITNGEPWRVRLVDGEYELTTMEITEWVLNGRLTPTHDVRPPTTKRWEHAGNCIELQQSFSEHARLVAAEQFKAEAPIRAAVQARGIRIKSGFKSIGCGMGIFGLIILFSGTDLGIVFGIGLGAIGLIIFLFGTAL